MPDQDIKKQENGSLYEMTSVLLRFLKEEKNKKAPDYSQIEIPVKHLKRTSFTYESNMSPIAGAFIANPKYDISLPETEIHPKSIGRTAPKTGFVFAHEGFADRSFKKALPVTVNIERKAHFAADSKRIVSFPRGIKKLSSISPERVVIETPSASERTIVLLSPVVTSYSHVFCHFGNTANEPKKIAPLPKRITETVRDCTPKDDISFNGVSVPKGIGTFARFTKTDLMPDMPRTDIKKTFLYADLPQIKAGKVFFSMRKSINEIKTFDPSIFEHKGNASLMKIGVRIEEVGKAVRMREKVRSLMPHFENQKMRPAAQPKIPPKPDFSGAYREIKDSLKH